MRAPGGPWGLLTDLGAVVPGVETTAALDLPQGVDLRAAWSFPADDPETTRHWDLFVWVG